MIERGNEKLVNLSPLLCKYVKGPANRYWKRRRIFLESGHFYGRSRNVYSIAIRRLEKAWTHAGHGRQNIKSRLTGIWAERISAVTESLGLNYWPFVHALARQNIALDRKVLADLAWSEPRTFRSLVEVARTEASKDPASGAEPSKNVILRKSDAEN